MEKSPKKKDLSLSGSEIWVLENTLPAHSSPHTGGQTPTGQSEINVAMTASQTVGYFGRPTHSRPLLPLTMQTSLGRMWRGN